MNTVEIVGYTPTYTNNQWTLTDNISGFFAFAYSFALVICCLTAFLKR